MLAVPRILAAKIPRILAVVYTHGTRDPVIPFAAGQATAKLFEAAGYTVRFTSVSLAGHALGGIGHTIAPALQAALRPPSAAAPRPGDLGLRGLAR